MGPDFVKLAQTNSLPSVGPPKLYSDQWAKGWKPSRPYRLPGICVHNPDLDDAFGGL